MWLRLEGKKNFVKKNFERFFLLTTSVFIYTQHNKMKVKKPTSKRRSTRMAEGIKKKAAAHNRKQKKLAKKDVTWKSRHKKDPGIPSAFPYKDQILAEMEEKRREEIELKEEKRQEKLALQAAKEQEKEATFAEKIEVDEDYSTSATSNRLGALLESARVAAEENEEEDEEEFEEDEDDEEVTFKINAYDSSDKAAEVFQSIYKQAVDRSDVVLYVLDARDPEGTRSKQVEEAVLADSNKRLVFLLNKADLIPTKALQKWLAKLRQTAPTIPVIASTAAPNAHTFTHKGLDYNTSTIMLLNSLTAYANQAKPRRQIVAGIVGYPNVGKSSIINALHFRRNHTKILLCPVDTVAGVTTSIRPIKIDSKLKVLDTPGFVFPNERKQSTDEHTRLVLLNALPHKFIGDPNPAVALLLKRLLKSEILKEKLFKSYGIASLIQTSPEDTLKDFLVYVARKRGRLNKGGVPDFASAATSVITDWRDGRIVGWTVPKASDSKIDKKTEKKLAKWNKEFNLDKLVENFDNEDVEMS